MMASGSACATFTMLQPLQGAREHHHLARATRVASLPKMAPPYRAGGGPARLEWKETSGCLVVVIFWGEDFLEGVLGRWFIILPPKKKVRN